MNKVKFFSIVLLILSFIQPMVAQENEDTLQEVNYNIEFLKAARFKGATNNSLHVVFLVTPKKKKDFPPIMSMKLTYFLDGSSEENRIDLMIQPSHVEGHITLIIHGENYQVKSPDLAFIVKDKMKDRKIKKFLLLEFNFENKIDMNVKKMGLVYGLWQQNKGRTRVEKRYDFDIEYIDF